MQVDARAFRDLRVGTGSRSTPKTGAMPPAIYQQSRRQVAGRRVVPAARLDEMTTMIGRTYRRRNKASGRPASSMLLLADAPVG